MRNLQLITIANFRKEQHRYRTIDIINLYSVYRRSRHRNFHDAATV